MDYLVQNQRKRTRIRDLYMIYILSDGDVKHPVHLDLKFNNVLEGYRISSRPVKFIILDYFLQKRWVILNRDPNYPQHPEIPVVNITAEGIDQAELWEEKYGLNRRITGRSYWLTIDMRKSIQDVIDISNPKYRSELLSNLKKDFNIGELKELCFEMNIKYEDLNGISLSEKCLELIEYLLRTKRVPEFINLCHIKRPNSSWGSN